MLNLSEFVEATIAAIGDAQTLLPTVIDFNRGEVRVLDGVPDNIDQTYAVRDWLSTLSLRNFAVAYRSGEYIIIRRILEGEEEVARLVWSDGSWQNCLSASVG